MLTLTRPESLTDIGELLASHKVNFKVQKKIKNKK
jgi:hypothetical protein